MNRMLFFDEQHRHFLELAYRFQENVVAFQRWEQAYIEQLHHRVQQRRHIDPKADTQLPRWAFSFAETFPTEDTPDSPTDVTDEQWQRIALLLPKRRRAGRPGADPRTTLNGILYVLHAHCSWRAMPQRYGNNVTCWRRLLQWQNDGTWDRIQHVLQCEVTAKNGQRPLPVSSAVPHDKVKAEKRFAASVLVHAEPLS